jgi:hypothetical protein
MSKAYLHFIDKKVKVPEVAKIGTRISVPFKFSSSLNLQNNDNLFLTHESVFTHNDGFNTADTDVVLLPYRGKVTNINREGGIVTLVVDEVYPYDVTTTELEMAIGKFEDYVTFPLSQEQVRKIGYFMRMKNQNLTVAETEGVKELAQEEEAELISATAPEEIEEDEGVNYWFIQPIQGNQFNELQLGQTLEYSSPNTFFSVQKVGDKTLLFYYVPNEYAVLPRLAEVVEINQKRDKLTLKITEVYKRTVSVERFTQLESWNLPRSPGIYHVTQKEFEEVVEEMDERETQVSKIDLAENETGENEGVKYWFIQPINDNYSSFGELELGETLDYSSTHIPTGQKVGDKLLLFSYVENEYLVLPRVAEITEVNQKRNRLTLKIVALYSKPVSAERFKRLLNRTFITTSKIDNISEKQFEKVVAEMGELQTETAENDLEEDEEVVRLNNSINYYFYQPFRRHKSDLTIPKGKLVLPYGNGKTATEVVPGDKMLLFGNLNEEYQVLPCVCEVTALNYEKKELTIKTEAIYNRPVPYEAFMRIQGWSSRNSSIVYRIRKDNFEKVVELMKKPRPEAVSYDAEDIFVPEPDNFTPLPDTEQALLDYLKNYIASEGYYFDEETIYNYHICLKTRPFLILAGLSGTGKSKLTRLYAQALGYGDNYYKRVAVRPNWNDDQHLLGYFDIINGEYIAQPAVDFLLQASADKKRLYFFCLDEMNLARVEYYFSQFLSALEEETPDKRCIDLYSLRTAKVFGKKLAVPPQITIPPNLMFTGTINIDETTHPISDKVIDRANTLEFYAPDLSKLNYVPPAKPAQMVISAQDWLSYRKTQPDETKRAVLIDINALLAKANLGLGFRTIREIELYLANSSGVLPLNTALDLQIKQRILPKVRGNDTPATETLLKELTTLFRRENLTRAEQKLTEMQQRLKQDGYTNFWR